MASSTRRAFLRGAATIPFAVWFEQFAWAQTVRTRFDARSTNGKRMLRIYAEAVRRMRDATSFAEGNPRSWTFQWYTHQVKGNIQNNVQNKANEIARIYPSASAARSLALEMWNTCQSHLGQPEDYFLPWHRMYVFYFENIIRRVSGNNDFTLPYWNYSLPENDPNHGVLPEEFRLPNDPVFSVLFVDKRNPGVNNGQPIDQGQPSGTLSTNALRQCRYSPTSTQQGFNMALDFGLHGTIHVLTGNSQNMGSVPWAAFDPIFWLHHCNIDRLWASWNRAGRRNPTNTSFLNKTFIFADGAGNRVVSRIRDFLSIAALRYQYDRLEPVTNTCPTGTGAAAAPRTLVTTREPAITLGRAPVKTRLTPAAGGAAAVPLGRRIERLTGNRRLYLILRNLRTEEQPGVTYHLYLELPAETPGAAASEYFVGSINFFHAEHHGHEGHVEADEPEQPRFYSFDITELAKKLKEQGRLVATAELTIAPADTPASEATPVIGEVSLVEGPEI